METKFTSGEWVICELNKAFHINSLNSEHIASLTRIDMPNAAANARLIAAAPEMYRHLVKCIEALELIGKQTGQSMPLTVEDARKAIKKATE